MAQNTSAVFWQPFHSVATKKSTQIFGFVPVMLNSITMSMYPDKFHEGRVIQGASTTLPNIDCLNFYFNEPT